MIRHLFRLVWNRKRQNLLLTLEIFLSFLVLAAVMFFGVLNATNWLYPLGFSTERLWAIELAYPEAGLPERHATADAIAAREKASRTLAEIYAALRSLPEVEQVTGAFSAPYEGSAWVTMLGSVASYMNAADDEFAGVMRMKVSAGRWFSVEDNATTGDVAVINQRLARELFGDRNPIGQTLPKLKFDQFGAARVVGVFEEFRQAGELMAPPNYTFYRMRAPRVLPTVLTIRVAPGTTAAFEQTLAETLQPVARDWRFSVETMDTRRQAVLRESLIPLTVMSIVAVFLLLMVALGLTGVVWQSVTRRFQEFGLRRANGATAEAIRRQVLAELAILTTLALAAGVALVAQLPVLALADPDLQTPAPVFVGSIVLSCAVIYLLTLLCGWYPSRLATRIQPAEALHYE